MSAKDMSGNAWQEAIEEIASYLSVGVEGCTPEESVTRIKEAVFDFTRVQLERAVLAEAALKKAQKQPAVAWVCGKDVTMHKEYAEWFMRFTQEDCTPLYALPVPAAPTVAAPAVPEEWRAGLSQLLDTFERCEAGFPPHVELRFAVRDEARALLQSTGDQK